jgi:hypothetical protein
MPTLICANTFARHKCAWKIQSMGKAILTYYIWEGVLVGHMDGNFIQISAVSGGGGGEWVGLR